MLLESDSFCPSLSRPIIESHHFDHNSSIFSLVASQTDTSASLPSQATTIAEHISITSSHLDYQQQNIQSDGVFSPLQTKKYHPGEESEVENEIGDEELQGSSLNRGPYFESLAPKNITAIAGQSAYLNCRVRNLGNRTVSCWREECV
jgi:hypothetical protein